MGTTSSVLDYALLPGNYPHQQGQLNYTSHPSSRLVTAHFVAVTNWNSDDDTAVEQSEATSDAWTPTPVVTPHSEEAGDIEYDADWAENVSLRLRHHVLEEGLEHHPWEHYSEEDFFN